MDLLISPGPLRGAVTPPPSKSLSHRALIAAALAGAPGCVHGAADSLDLQATARCLDALLTPGPELPQLDCGESGSTLRFLLPLALVLRGGGRFTGHGRLLERPLGPYEELFCRHGVLIRREGNAITFRGALAPGVYPLPGHVSSQFVSGLLFALPLLPGDSEISLTTPLESAGYVTLTLDTLHAFQVQARWDPSPRRLRVPGFQRYRPAPLMIEADWSQAAFWYAADFFSGGVAVQGLTLNSHQGDRVILDFCAQLARPGDLAFDLSDCPDLLPPLAVMAARRRGRTRILHAQRLRLKESDRLHSTAALLTALGGQVEERPDGLSIHGLPTLRGGTVDGANDHRIVMAAAVAAAACTQPVVIRGAEAVNKSYPRFFGDFRQLGGIYHVL